MKRYYCVCTKFYADGSEYSAVCMIKDSNEKPKDTYKETPNAEVFYDWFDSVSSAYAYMNNKQYVPQNY